MILTCPLSDSRPDQAFGSSGWRAEDTMLRHTENHGNTLRLHSQCCQVCNQHYVPSNSRPDQATVGPGGELKTPCYCMERTMTTPSDSIYSVARYVTSIMSPSNSRPDQATGGPGWRAEDTMLLHGENYDNTLRLHLQCCQVCNQHYVAQ